MARVSWLVLWLCVLGAAGEAGSAGAQGLGEQTAVRTAGTIANLFETLDPSSPIDGARLQLPESWEVRGVHLLRYGTVPVPVQHRTEADGTVLLTMDPPIQGPHELVLRVQVGDDPGTYRWHLEPFERPKKAAKTDSLGQQRVRPVDRLTRRVEVELPSRPDGPNRAVDLEGATRPLRLRLPPHLSLGRTVPFTVEFWMRTTGLDQVLLSTWSGDEAVPYPAEFVVDQSGRLRFYCGQAGQHQALRTKAPVADDRWHRAAVVYDEADSRLRLILDGTVVDSSRARALPSAAAGHEVAIGGRLPRQGDDESNQQLYTGRLDELRIWPEARSGATLRQGRGRPFTASAAEREGGPLHLRFNEPPDPELVEWAEGVRRVPTVLSFRSPLRNLRAHTEDGSVTLRWQAEAEEGTFVVERSPDGVTFAPVARLDPSNAGSPSHPEEITYTDEEVPGTVVYYRIRQVYPDESVERATGTIKVGLGAELRDQRAVELVGNFPNPFEKSTRVAYRVREPQSLTLTVWDLSGKRLATLAEGVHEPGYYEKSLNAGDLPSGPYFARLETPQGVQSHRMVLLK